jgi:sulfofructose kinase
MSGTIEHVDVAGVGLNATDTIIRLPHFPSLDSKVELVSADLRAGGQVASALVACQSWGLQTRYVGKVGDDDAARFQAEGFTRAGVEAHLLAVPGCPSQNAFILVDEKTGERTILWKRDPRLTISAEEVKREWITNSRALLVDGHDTAAAVSAARFAGEARIPVVADLDYLYDGVKVLLEYADFLMASRYFPAELTGRPDLLESLPEISKGFGCQVSGVTLGRQGALAWNGERFFYCRGYRVRAVDTTGAGDIFHGAFVFALLRGWPIEKVLEFSCAAAALNCTAIGARGGIRPVTEIDRLMREGERSEPAFDASELEKRRLNT